MIAKLDPKSSWIRGGAPYLFAAALTLVACSDRQRDAMRPPPPPEVPIPSQRPVPPAQPAPPAAEKAPIPPAAAPSPERETPPPPNP